jgi:hypothetical protein
MKKKDESLKWFDAEIRRIRRAAFYYGSIVDGQSQSTMDVASQRQLDRVEKLKAEYLRGLH